MVDFPGVCRPTAGRGKAGSSARDIPNRAKPLSLNSPGTNFIPPFGRVFPFFYLTC